MKHIHERDKGVLQDELRKVTADLEKVSLLFFVFFCKILGFYFLKIKFIYLYLKIFFLFSQNFIITTFFSSFKYMKALQKSEDERKRIESDFIQIREKKESITQWEAQISEIIQW